MRFKCGQTPEEELAAYRKRQAKYKALGEWHNYFVWWPTTISKGKCVWLETVERKYLLNQRRYDGYIYKPDEYELRFKET